MGPSYNDSFGNSQVPGGGGSAGMSGAGGAASGGGANAGASNVGVGAVGAENTVPVAGGSVPVGSVVGGVRITPRQEAPEATSATPQGMPAAKAEAVQPVQAPMQGAEATQPSGVPEANQQAPGIQVAAEALVAPVAPQQLETPMAAQQSEMSGVQQPAEVPATQQPTGVAMAQGQVAQGQAMQEAQQMPQQMPMTSSTNLPVSSGKGDIILAPSGEKGKNKGLMIAGVVVAALVVLLLVVVGIKAMLPKSSSGATVATVMNVEDSFYSYANYLLYGQESKNDFEGSFDAERTYEVAEEFAALDGKKTAYYKELDARFEAFVSRYEKDSKQYDEDIVEVVDEYIIRYKDFQDIVAVKSGEELAQSDSDSVAEYVAAYKSYGWLQNKMTERFELAGCVKNHQVVEVCVKEMDYTDDDMAIEIAMRQNSSTMDNVERMYLRYLTEGCWEIRDVLILLQEEYEN